MAIRKEIYRDDFEQFLQETADGFRMYPSARTWQGIYNSLHPGKKWPSAFSWLLIFFSFFILCQPAAPTVLRHETSNQSNAKILALEIRKAANASGTIQYSNIAVIRGEEEENAFRPESPNSGEGHYAEWESVLKENELPCPPGEQRNEDEEKYNSSNAESSLLPPAFIRIPMANTDSRSALPDFNHPKEDSRLEYQFYATPSIAFRELRKKNEEGEVLNESSGMVLMPSFNMEAGGNIIYRFNTFMRIKAGLQLNYSSYRRRESAANENDGTNGTPGASSSLLAAMQPAESDGIFNENYQVSIPLGADLMLAGSDCVQWFAGATVQPTLVLPGATNGMASESGNLTITDKSLIRNWNLNGGVETFISLKILRGITLNAGPQLRYQLLSTYKDPFLYNERLYNVGIKLGISSSF